MRSHVASAVACAYGGVRDSVQMRRCSRRQRCCQILRARWPRWTLRCAQARQRSCESRRPVSSATAVALGTQPARAEMPQHKPPLYGQRRRRMRHRQGDDGRVRPPMRQPCARPRTSRSLSRAPARVMLRRRAVRSLVQHAAHVRGADGPLPSLGVPLTARAVTRVSMRGRRGLRHSTAVHRADLASTASGTMQLSQVCGAGVCRHVLPANAACGGYDCFRR
jgi:hypothetical protein